MAVAANVVVVAFVARNVDANSVVEVALVVVAFDPIKLVMSAFVAEKTEAKNEVEVAFVVVAFTAIRSVADALTA